jgi:methionyl-tRNA synthetase
MSDCYSLTTPIYYVNAAPHLGTAYTTIAADTLARFERMDGKDVFFLTGIDEHGQKVAQTAAEKGVTPQEWCDTMAPLFQKQWEELCITNDDFIRTTAQRHVQGAQKFMQLLYDKGFIYRAAYEDWYCIPEETFFTDEQVEVDESGVKVCPDCHRPVQKVKEENYFFKLSEFAKPLLAFYEAHPDFIEPVTRRNEVISFVKGGLTDLSISRTTFDWGIPLPFDEAHVMYVWVDALLNYMTAMGYGGTPEEEAVWERRWPVQYHFVGKDIIRFHCVIWPAMLMAAGLPLPEHIFAHGFLLTKGEKMSKSKGNAMKPADLIALFGVDAYRYYFMTDVNFGADGSISMERMVQVYNADLANSWGNLCSRVFNMCGKYFEGKVPVLDAATASRLKAELGDPLEELAASLYERYATHLGAVEFSEAAAAVHELCARANLYVEESAPWNLAKSPETHDELAFVIYNALEAIRIMALYYAPLMPNTSAEVFDRLSLGDITTVTDLAAATRWGALPAGNAVEKGEPLFPRLDIDAIGVSA